MTTLLFAQQCRPLTVLSKSGALAALAVLALQGCAQFEGEKLPLETESSAVKSGSTILGNDFAGTARLTIMPPADEAVDCSGSLIAQNLILTSAECLVDVVENGAIVGTISVGFGPDGSEPAGGIAGSAVEFHRYFNEDSAAAYQLAIITLAADAPLAFEPVELNAEPLPDNFTGPVTLVGYGETDDDIGIGSRRAVATTARAVTPDFFLAGSTEMTTCRGDSGGPVFADLGSGVVQVGVTNATNSCSERTQRTRVDRHVADFIFRYVDRFSGDCQEDNNCVTDGCRTPDPDCLPDNVCGWGNTCATAADSCPSSDWDCPLGSFVGEECATSLNCEENGQCIAAVDDDTFLYCARPCTPGVQSTCPGNMTCEADGSGGNECVFGSPSPGSQGFSCTAGTECRSGICEDLICVNTCTIGANECPGDFTCGPSKEQAGTNVCLGEDLSGGGGFCSIGSGTNGGAGLLLLLALLGIGRRRQPTSS